MNAPHAYAAERPRLKPQKSAPGAAARIMHVVTLTGLATFGLAVASPSSGPAADTLEFSAATAPHYAWRVDLDGDGVADLANPTGHAVRGEDTYGSGAYGASRSGGRRRHRGADYVAEPGELVHAPIAGQVTRTGFAYRNDERYSFVELQDHAQGRTVRVLYVGPDIAIGDVVQAGDPIGRAQDLSMRYPRGITNHVHVEMRDSPGFRVDPSDLIPAGSDPHGGAAAMTQDQVQPGRTV